MNKVFKREVDRIEAACVSGGMPISSNSITKFIEERSNKVKYMRRRERLQRIVEIIEQVDNRCQFSDQLREMTQEEMSAIWNLARGRGRTI